MRPKPLKKQDIRRGCNIEELNKRFESIYDRLDKLENKEVKLTEEQVKQLEEMEQREKQIDKLSEELDEEQTEIDDEPSDDDKSICTEKACEEITKNPDMIRVGSYDVTETKCNSCIKKSVKQWKKFKKDKEKAKKLALKQMREEQKKLIKIEQADLKRRMQNLRKGRPEDYGFDADGLQKREEIKKKLKCIAKKNDIESNININMYL